MSNPTPSKGLAFLLATVAAMPRAVGDRDRTTAMHEAMSLAVRNRFEFHTDDAQALNRLNIDTCVGVFQALALTFYYQACLAGGTYPRLWEKTQGIRAWKAAQAVFPRNHGNNLIEDSRVCTGAIVLMPPSFSPFDPSLATYHSSKQVWWITDFSDTSINLCRYVPAERNGPLFKPGGAPARRRQLSRRDWDIFQDLMRSMLGQTVRWKWTDSDEDEAMGQHWYLLDRARPRIAALPMARGGFASHELAIAFVRKEANKGNALALKALLMHENAKKLPPLESDAPLAGPLVELAG